MTCVELCTGEGYMTLFATGHADYAPRGEDIICAGISALIYALAKSVQDMEKEGLLEKSPVLRISPGRAEISIFPGKKAGGRCLGAFETVRAGLELIAGAYPGNMKIIYKLNMPEEGRKEGSEHG